MEFLKVKNWDCHQHYKNRCPPWIKLHTDILNDRKFTALSCASRGLLMQLWVLASRNDGQVPNDLDELKFQLRDKTIKAKDINLLIDKGFLKSCKQPLADASKCLSETEGEGETEREGEREYTPHFLDFWKAYPRKIGKGAAWSAWKKTKGASKLLPTMLKAVETQKKSQAWQEGYIPNPATWINQRRWEDEPEESGDVFRKLRERHQAAE